MIDMAYVHSVYSASVLKEDIPQRIIIIVFAAFQAISWMDQRERERSFNSKAEMSYFSKIIVVLHEKCINHRFMWHLCARFYHSLY